jgi:hypothetical protein
MRAIGAANIVFCATGLAYFSWSLSLHWNRWPGSPSMVEWAEFFGIAVVSLFLISYSAYLGVRLFKNDMSVIPRVNVLFVVEIIYLIFFVGLSWFLVPGNDPKRMGIVVVFWGIAEGPLVPQLAMGYPFIALIVMLLLHRHNRRTMG